MKTKTLVKKSKVKIELPKITKSQKLIIYYLYKFRFLTIAQIQKLLNNKDSKTIRVWLHDLEKKKYISIIKNKKDKTKPHIICLAQRAGQILKGEKNINQNFLLYLYKEKSKSGNFRQRHLFIADSYFYFLNHKEKGSKFSFFTKQDLYGYRYFPEELPDAYIDVQNGKENSRYFLDYFDSTAQPGNLRYRVRYYFNYLEDNNWQENTKASFPAILFICETVRRKNHLIHYAKSQIEKSFEDVEIFTTLKDNIKFSTEGVNIWEKVEIE